MYGNATAEDFWNAQTAASKKPVDKIMSSLIAQPGVPRTVEEKIMQLQADKHAIRVRKIANDFAHRFLET